MTQNASRYRNRGIRMAILLVPLLGGAQSFTISTLAGNGTNLDSGDGGPATQASLCAPVSVAVDATGNIYVADSTCNRVRKISPAGIITTFAGPSSGSASGYSGDGGPATSALLNDPEGLAVDSAGNLYIAEDGNAVIRKVSTSGIITTVAGNGQPPTGVKDGVAATSTALAGAHGVALDAAGNLYIAEEGGLRIRKVTNGTITTVAGGGPGWDFLPGSMGDGGPATQATLAGPQDVTVDAAGNIYISDTVAGKVRMVSASTGTITTVAGNSSPPGFAGDGGPAINASFSAIKGLAVNSAGNVYIADSGNSRIRMVSKGVITTVAGNGYTFYTGDGPATSVALGGPYGLWLRGNNIYVAALGDTMVRLLTATSTGGGGGPVIGEVDNAFSNIENSPIQSGAWVAIKGTNLSNTNPGRGWNANESFPTTMDGTSVTINGKAAFMYYISPTQVNVQAPTDSALGPVNVMVTNNGVNSAAATAQYQSSSPALLQWGGGQYLYALVSEGNTFIGNPAAVANTVSAHAGDTVTFWATGLGATNPPVAAGQQPTTFPPVATTPTVTVGGANATVLGAVLRFAGLYQVNVQLPASLPAGDSPIRISQGSFQSPSGVLINIQ